MFDIIKELFNKEKTDYAKLVREGAVIVDVRSKNEYSAGHIKGSINIPVEILRDNLRRLNDKNKTVITCCASGMRSASAKSILRSNGYSSVHNGGGWHSLNSKLK